MTRELDFWALKEEGYFELPGIFAATWLQEHKEDPYWMAHQLTNALFTGRDYSSPDFSRLFMENWILAREIHGITNES